MYDRILVPADDPDEMRPVFEQAAEIARPHDATVHVVYVADERAFLTLDDELTTDVREQLRTQGERTTERAAEFFETAGIDVETATLSGDPADEVLDYAEEVEADLIVMGTRRRANSQGAFGSVSQAVTNRAKSPVLIADIADES